MIKIISILIFGVVTGGAVDHFFIRNVDVDDLLFNLQTLSERDCFFSYLRVQRYYSAEEIAEQQANAGSTPSRELLLAREICEATAGTLIFVQPTTDLAYLADLRDRLRNHYLLRLSAPAP